MQGWLGRPCSTEAPPELIPQRMLRAAAVAGPALANAWSGPRQARWTTLLAAAAAAGYDGGDGPAFQVEVLS